MWYDFQYLLYVYIPVYDINICLSKDTYLFCNVLCKFLIVTIEDLTDVALKKERQNMKDYTTLKHVNIMKILFFFW